jgi:sterol 3beta-glucosyltransferase
MYSTQPFWGSMIAKAGAGPDPIPQKEMTSERLADALKFVKSARAKQAAQKMGEQIRSEVSV